MKTRIETPKAIVSGKAETGSFTIKQDHKAFRAFSDGLYSDKIGAIIREISSNAVDAHMESGNTQPFAIFLPCAENPRIVFRDFGTGLSKEDVVNVYTRYGESTKDEDDDKIGGFGLGSKTPFAYTDQFFVRSYHNGMLFTYVFYFSEDEPRYSLVGEESTNEINGLEIYFDVDDCDFKEFETKARHILPWMTIVPDVWVSSREENGFFYAEEIEANNLRQIMIDDLVNNTVYSDEFITIGNFHNLDLFSIEQGGVVYSANMKGVDIPELTKITHIFRNSGYQLILKCPIGTIELARSREYISWSRKVTVPNIIKMAQRIIEKGIEQYNSLIVMPENPYQVNSLKYHLMTQFKDSSSNFLGKNYSFKNVDFSMYYVYLGAKENEPKLFTSSYRVADDSYFKKIFIDSFANHTDTKLYIKDNRKGGYKVARKDKNSYFSTINPYVNYPDRKIAVIFRDGKRTSAKMVIQTIAKEDKHSLVFLVDRPKGSFGKDITNTEITDFYKSQVKAKILSFFEADETDIDFHYESNYNFSRQSSTVREYVKNNLSLYYLSGYSINLTNTVDMFNGKKVLVLNKKGHGAEFGDDMVNRSAITTKLRSVEFLFDVEYDYVVIANKKEKKALAEVASIINFNDVVEDFLKKGKINSHLITIMEYLAFQNTYHQYFNVGSRFLFFKNLCKKENISFDIDEIEKEKTLINQKIRSGFVDIISGSYREKINFFFSYNYNVSLNNFISMLYKALTVIKYNFGGTAFDSFLNNHNENDLDKNVAYFKAKDIASPTFKQAVSVWDIVFSNTLIKNIDIPNLVKYENEADHDYVMNIISQHIQLDDFKKRNKLKVVS
jgi:hypothetical protein